MNEWNRMNLGIPVIVTINKSCDIRGFIQVAAINDWIVMRIITRELDVTRALWAGKDWYNIEDIGTRVGWAEDKFQIRPGIIFIFFTTRKDNGGWIIV